MNKDTPPNFFQRQFWLNIWNTVTEHSFYSLLQAVGVVLAYLLLRWLLFRLIDSILERVLSHESRIGLSEERAARLQTLQGLFRSVVGYVLFFLFGILFLQALGFNIMPFITTAGVLGLAIGFGAQKLVRDVISGFFIVIDNLFVVGDTVTIGAITGQVQEMGMRVTRVIDVTGRLHHISNGDIGTVTNLSRYPLEDFIEVNVGAAADLNQVVKAINTAGEALFANSEAHYLKNPPRVLGITAFSATSITVRVAVVSDPRDLPAAQMRVREAVRAALLAADIPLA
ncbi:MAG TPA: mechanosensitive ion channel family protein [Chthonomonadaceae bacterium]|nr:mechanosensitive ion channel family protein [Chthonomonadaceae bacterium]